MRFSERIPVQKRPYAKISLKKREQLVKYVLTDHLSISKAAKRIKIKLTTARLIVKKYKETGTFPMKKFREMPPVQVEITHPQQIVMGQEIQVNKFSEVEAFSNPITHSYPPQFYGSSPSEYGSGLIFYYYWPFAALDPSYS